MSAMPTAANKLELTALPGLPLVRPGDDLVAVIANGLERLGESLRDRDVLVLAQKIVSKSENRLVDLRGVTPSERARQIGEEVLKDPRLIEVILSESREVLRTRPGVIIVQTRQGLVMANAGVDASNVEQAGGSEKVLLLPVDPDASCRRLREGLKARFDVDVAVVMNDSVGRAWRNGTVGLAMQSKGVQIITTAEIPAET